MTRREILSLAAAGMASAAPPRIDRSRIAVLNDEAGPAIEDAIEFARKHGLKLLELRGARLASGYQVYERMTPAEVKEHAKRIADAGLKVSFLNSALLKFVLRGTTSNAMEDYYVKLYQRLGLTDEILWKERNENLKRALEAASILGVGQIRTFTFWRVAEPKTVWKRIADILGEMGEIAGKAKIRLLMENEYSTNIASGREAAEILKTLPSPHIGINWDPQNAEKFETPFPDGYEKMPVRRIHNVQIKYQGLLGTQRLPWGDIFKRLARDGYKGAFGLETHFGGGPKNFEASARCIEEIFRLIG